MPWKNQQPTEARNKREETNFDREVWTRLKFAQFTWTPPSIPATTQLDITVGEAGTNDVVTKAPVGLRIGMDVKLTPPSALPTGFVCDAFVVTKDVLNVRVWNFTTNPGTPPAGAWTFSGVII